MSVLVTGAAGFIGMHVAAALLARGEDVVGVDNINEYYDVRLKHARLAELERHPAFAFHALDLGDHARFLATLRAEHGGAIDRVVHLAAQPGVRYSLENPFAYVQANVVGHLAILEFCRHQADFKHLVYASSSSVYGANTALPFAVADRTDTPLSLYAATKKADELMGHCYAHLFGIPQTGLRFFTVYGPWGRPDMALWIFCAKILAGEPIPVFNNGQMKRDFTYVDDVVAGVLAALDRPPAPVVGPGGAPLPPQRIYNIGNHRSEPLMELIGVIEAALGRKAIVDFRPMQPGDVVETFADVAAAQRDLGFRASTCVDVGVPLFVDWYLGWRARA